MFEYSVCFLEEYGKRECDGKSAQMHTFDCSKRSGFENQLSSTSTSGVRDFPLNTTVAIDDVTTTLLTDGTFAHDLRILIVPLNAGSINSAWDIDKKEMKIEVN